MAEKVKSRKKIWLSLLAALLIVVFALYQLLTSPQFLLWVLRRVNQSIPGEILTEDFRFSAYNRQISAKQIQYRNDQNEEVATVQGFALHFDLSNAFRGRLSVPTLEVKDFSLDIAKLPKTKGPSRWKTVLRLLLKRLSVDGGHVAKAQVKLKGEAALDVEELRVKLTPQVLRDQKIALQVRSLRMTHPKFPLALQGLDFSGDLRVPVLRDYDFFFRAMRGELKVARLSLKDHEFLDLKFPLKIERNVLSLPKTTIAFAGTAVDLALDYDSQSGDLGVDIQNQKPIALEAIPGISKNLRNTFEDFTLDLKAELSGKTWEELDGSVKLKLLATGKTPPIEDKIPDHELNLAGNLDNGVLKLKQFKINSTKTDLTATGQVDFAKQRFDAKIDAASLDVRTLIHSLTDLNLGGTAAVQGTIGGPFRRPEFYAEAKASESFYSFLNFGALNGVFQIKNGDLSFRGTGANAGQTSSVQVEVKNIYEKTRVTKLATEFSGLDVTKLLDNPQIQGKLDGRFDLDIRGPGQLFGTTKAQIQNFQALKFKLGTTDIEGKLETGKFTLSPIQFQPPNYAKIVLPKPVVFEFKEGDWKVGGEVLPGTTLEGKFLKAQPKQVELNVAAKNLDLRPLLAALEMSQREAYADGTVAMKLGLKETPSQMDFKISRFVMPIEEGQLQNDGPIEISFRTPTFDFKRARFSVGGSTFQLSGTYATTGAVNLDLDGKLDLGVLALFPSYVREGSGQGNVDIQILGTAEQPKILGGVTFENGNLSLRVIRGDVENLNGQLKFDGKSLVFQNLQGTMREGDLRINGRIDLDKLKPSFYDVTIVAREIAVAEPEVYKVVFSGDFSLKGPAGRALLSGVMDVNEGVYSREFKVSQLLLKPQVPSVPEPPNPLLQDFILDLTVRSPGELAIKNNIAEMYFNSDVKVTGPALSPKISGALEILSGEFSYFKVSFENARGVADFRDPKRGPYVDVTAEKEFEGNFGSMTVTAHIQGFTDNLNLNFLSNPPLEKRDILALVFTGALPGEKRPMSTTNLASSLLASQLSEVLRKPAQKASIDVLRFEANDPDMSKNLTSFVIGKRLTERLTLEFKTDLGVDEPLQGIQMEYLLLDNVLIKASQLTNGDFDFDLALRFYLK